MISVPNFIAQHMYKIVLGLIITATCIGGIFWFLHKTNIPEPVQQSTSTTAVFPIDQPTNQQAELSQNERFKLKFNEFLESEQSTETWTTFSDRGQKLTLDNVLFILSAHVQPNLLSLIDVSKWKMYKCAQISGREGVRDIVFSLQFLLQDTYQGNLYKDQMQYMSVWEGTILADVAPILFPATYYSSRPKQMGPFVDVGRYIHRAPVTFADDSEGMIGYIIIGDELLIGTNEECLHKTQELLFDTSS